MINKIISLTKIFSRDFYQNLNIVDKETKKINKKSFLFNLLIILVIAYFFVSYKGIEFFTEAGNPEVFLNLFFPFFMLLILFQIVVSSVNVYFFSKDLDEILPLPISSSELLIAKYLTLLIYIYISEVIFGLIPLIMYGMMNLISLTYFIWTIILLVIFPLISTMLISIISIILIKIFSFIKSKIILQNTVVFIMTIIVLACENMIIKIEMLKDVHFILKPFKYLLIGNSNFIKLEILVNILILSVVMFFIFINICKKIYIKMILECKSHINGKNKKIKIKVNRFNIGLSYVIKEIKGLFRKPIFLIQTILPLFIILQLILVIGKEFIPSILVIIQSNEEIKKGIEDIQINAEAIMLVLGLLQCLFCVTKLSITSISREGKDAIFMKYIPISYYRQFIYKNIPQVIVNFIVSAIVLKLIYNIFPNIGLINIILLFVLSIFINLINSYIMVATDIRKPFLEWNSEQSVLKNNRNSIYRYSFTLIMILTFMYLSSIFKEIQLTKFLFIETGIFMIIFIILDRIIYKKQKNLFDNII